MWELICVSWSGNPLTDEERVVVRNVAAKQLRMHSKRTTICFAHTICEGSLTRKDEGSFGTFSGTFFQAELDRENGQSKTFDFLIPRNSEWLDVDDDSIVISTRPLPGGDFGVKQIKTKGTRVV